MTLNALLTFAVRLSGAALGLLIHLVLARLLGASDAGLFYQAFTLMFLLSLIARFGMDTTLMRYCSISWENNDPVSAGGYMCLAFCVVLGLGCFLGAGLYFFAQLLAAELFSNPLLTLPLQIAAMGVIPLALLWVFCGALKGIRKPTLAGFFEATTVPGVCIMLLLVIGLYLQTDLKATQALQFYLCAVLLSFLGALLTLSRFLPLSRPSLPDNPGELILSAHPLMWSALFTQLVTALPTIALGIFASDAAVGIYNVAFRVSSAIGIILIVVNSIIAPKIAASYDKGQKRHIESLVGKSVLIMALICVPILLLFIAAPSWLLGFFGEEFLVAGPALQVIALGQIFNVLTGSVGFILMMSGHGHIMRNIVIFTCLFSLTLNLLLTPSYGVIGAAIATATCLVLQNLLAVLYVSKKLGIRTLPRLSHARVNRPGNSGDSFV